MKLQVSANGRYLQEQDGKPFFYLGDTAWLLFQRLNTEETEEYLQDRAAKGFTVIQAYLVRGLEPQHPDGPTNLAGVGPFLDRDPTRPDERFFQNVDKVIRRANELGLVMALVTSKSWHVNEHAERVFNPENARIFGRYAAERYKDDAVLWYVGGDSRPGTDGATWEAMARGHKEGSQGEHLVSYHGCGSTSSSEWYHNADWLDFNSIQSGHGWAAKTYRFTETDYALTPPKPTVDMEPPYENHPTRTGPRITSHQVRQGAYWAMLAGAAGHGYGALDLFHLYKEDEGPFPRNGFMAWRTAAAYEGSRQVGTMRRLFELRPWYHLVPDQSLVVAVPEAEEDHIQAARADDGSFLLAYLPRGGTASIRTDTLTGDKIQIRWYDPRDGSWRDGGQTANTGTGKCAAPRTGENEDWLLSLEDAAKKLPLS